MKRIILWFMSTLTVVVLLFGYKTSTSGASDASTPAALSLTTITASPSTSATRTSSASKASTATATKTRTAKPATTKTITGSVIETQYGPVQVQLKVLSKKITAVEVLQYPGGGRSDEINAVALPILVNETMKAQSATIDMVSGATYTSDAYVQSLQSALDKAAL